MRIIKQVNIENRPYYLFIDMINIKSFDRNLLNIDKIPFESTDAVIYNIRHVTMKSLNHINIDTEISLYLVFNKSYKNIDIYYIGYISIKNIGDYESIHNVNPLHFFIVEVDGCIEENMGIST